MTGADGDPAAGGVAGERGQAEARSCPSWTLPLHVAAGTLHLQGHCVTSRGCVGRAPLGGDASKASVTEGRRGRKGALSSLSVDTWGALPKVTGGRGKGRVLGLPPGAVRGRETVLHTSRSARSARSVGALGGPGCGGRGGRGSLGIRAGGGSVTCLGTCRHTMEHAEMCLRRKRGIRGSGCVWGRGRFIEFHF